MRLTTVAITCTLSTVSVHLPVTNPSSCHLIQYSYYIKKKKTSHSFTAVPQSLLCLIFNSCLHCHKCYSETNLERGPINNLWCYLLKIYSGSILLFLQHLSPSTHLSQHMFIASRIYSTLGACMHFIWQRMRKQWVDGGREGAREILQYGGMSRCGEETERGNPRLLLPLMKFWSFKWSLQRSCLELSPFCAFCPFFQ